MNIFQEAILDRLIGAQHNEFDQHEGPLGLAFQALLDARLIDAEAQAQALGYPLIFSKALDAACTMLKDDVEQQRQLAIAVFAEVPPHTPCPELTSRRQVEAAIWCARRVHPLICRADCPFLQDAGTQIEEHFSRTSAAEPDLSPELATRSSCNAPTSTIIDPIYGSMVTLRCLGFHTIDHALEAALADKRRECPENSSCEGAAYAGRLAAHFEGVSGATDFCVAFARQLGM